MSGSAEVSPARHRPRSRRQAAIALLGCLACTTSMLAAQSGPGTPEPLVTQAARKVGVKRCLPLVAATAKRVTAGATRQDILVDWDRQAPDAGPLFSLTGMQLGAQPAVLSLSAVPASDGRCSLLVERMSVAASSCAAVARTDLEGLAGIPLVVGVTVYASPDQPSETYTLVGNGPNCLVIRRMTTFNWPQRR